jgi:hypothetical protein
MEVEECDMDVDDRRNVQRELGYQVGGEAEMEQMDKMTTEAETPKERVELNHMGRQYEMLEDSKGENKEKEDDS